MTSLYVAMQGGTHPCAIVIPTPRAVFSTRKAANAYIKLKQFPHMWYVRKVCDMTDGDSQ
jgi:hypothetical protein